MKVFKDIRNTSLCFLFIGIFLMSLFVVNAGDDFFYAAFSKEGLGHFLSAHVNHYLHTNGRCIVHILASVFLWLPHIIWKFTNAAMWVAIAMNIYRLINLYVKDTSKLKFIMFLLCGGFLTIHIEMAKESTIWLTGSFNYTYPLMMLTWYWYLLFTHENQNPKKLYLAGFLSAASMEQESAVAVIITFGYILYLISIKKTKINPVLKKAAIFTVLGAVSLFLAPGNLTRMGDEIGSSSGTINNILSGIDFMMNYSISSNYMLWLNIVFMVCCTLYLYKGKHKLAAILLPFEIAALLITNHSGEFEWLGIGYDIIFILSRIYYFVTAIFAVMRYFTQNKNPLPPLCLILGMFSCAFIVLSPTLGARVILFYEVMVIICLVMLMSESVRKNNRLYTTVHIVVFVLALCNIVYITDGFKFNNKVYKRNVQLIEEWRKSQNGDVHQKQYRNDLFEHSMPYNSDYHLGRYKEFFDIPENVQIIWE